MFKSKLIASFTLVACLSRVRGFLLAQDTVVNTDCGSVSGVAAGQNGPYSFRGIPYASPPVGQNRWSAPQEITTQNGNCWTGTLNATKFGNMCFQPAQNQTYSGSEDCLFLNVWTPSLSRDGKLPVAVWIHGGYLLNGDGNTETYAPTEQLAQDTNIVYVSMNYRLNAFGFMALQWLAGRSPKNVSGNYGFMDMIAALRWVNRNIEAFGGDKNQVSGYFSSDQIRKTTTSKQQSKQINKQQKIKQNVLKPRKS